MIASKHDILWRSLMRLRCPRMLSVFHPHTALRQEKWKNHVAHGGCSEWEEDVDIIVRHIRGVVDSFFARIYKSYPIKNPETIQDEFKAAVHDAANPFLHARTYRFVDELELFLASGWNIAAYDAAYMNHLGQNHPSETIEPATDHNVDRPLIPYLYIFDAASDDDIE